MLNGAMGSTLPLLVMEDTTFCRNGFTAAIFSIGWRSLILINTNATIPARSRKSSVRLRSFLSINS